MTKHDTKKNISCSHFRRIKYDYWSNGTGTKSDKDNDVYNLRALYGVQASDKLMLKTGLGYRYLIDKKKGARSTTGHTGYDRIQEYHYIPFIAETNLPVAGLNGKLKLEYDYFFYGKNQNEFTNSASNVTLENDDGYALKAS